MWRNGILLKSSRDRTVLLLFTTLALLACGGGAATPSPVPDPTSTPRPAGEELSAEVISSDLSIGPNRLVFFLLDRDSEIVRTETVDVSIVYLEDPSEVEPMAVPRARFRRWPLGGLGVYTTPVSFDRSGAWGLRVAERGPDGSTRSGGGEFVVEEESTTPAIGSPAPRSENKTSRDVAALEELTTARPPDPELYTMTIAEAVASGRPFVVVFATPAFCTTATCGPQVEVVGGLKDRYADRVNFIHVEVFDNPHEIQGDNEPRTAPAVEEWGLPSEPWTFVVDRGGRIAAKFEGFTTEEEIEEALAGVLR